MKALNELHIKIFADGADLASMKHAYREGLVKGFTTNPTLLRKAGVTDYEAFGRAVLAEITDLPVSFEVLSDDFAEMEREARQIASWGPNVYIKIRITNTKGESSIPLIHKLSADGLALNITAVLTREQVQAVAPVLSSASRSIVSIFAGRIADTRRDSIPYVQDALQRWIADAAVRQVEVFLPKFTLTSQFSLAETLRTMGMGAAFSDQADFSGMDASKQVSLTDVIHKAFVEVNEAGTEAAAATGAIVGVTSIMDPQPIPVFKADHPFLFLIREQQTGLLLFLGRVANPAR